MQMILVVDDEPVICGLIERVLRQKGFWVVTAANGADALSISESYRGEIELLITDVRMPGMDGPTLVRQLSAIEPGVPVLFMSGDCDPSDLEPFECSDFLAKPFSLDRLVEEVECLISEPRCRAVN
jgi:two-component system cell cycle sensor histidine kinase/response regulator CckA